MTPERSPPASRITGADSPVIADSSTDAIPYHISPSLGGNYLTGGYYHLIARPRARSMYTSSYVCRPLGDHAGVSLLNPGAGTQPKLFPRASARAVAKLANRTVNKKPEIECDKIGNRNLAGRGADRRFNYMNSKVRTAPIPHHERYWITPLDIRTEHDQRILQRLPQQLHGSNSLCALARRAGEAVRAVDLWVLEVLQRSPHL